uniref:Uncharacterized protein n=1 Tax=Anguilla anguilla TaxID=7936 RepID=A0A0E9X666_ANGAN
MQHMYMLLVKFKFEYIGRHKHSRCWCDVNPLPRSQESSLGFSEVIKATIQQSTIIIPESSTILLKEHLMKNNSEYLNYNLPSNTPHQ